MYQTLRSSTCHDLPIRYLRYHVLHHDQPQTVAQLIEDFCAMHAPQKPTTSAG